MESSDALNVTRLQQLEQEAQSLEMVAELVEIFFDDMVGRFEALRKDLDSGFYTSVERAAHAIKGASANVGAQQVAELAAALERAARQRDRVQDLSQLFTELERELRQARILLSEYVAARRQALTG